MPFFYWINVY